MARLERTLDRAGNGAANKAVSTLSTFYKWLVQGGEIDDNPCRGVASLPQAGRDTAKTLDLADATEAIELIRAYEGNDGHRDALLLLIYTLQRSGDILPRRWEDVVLDDDSRGKLPYLVVDRHKSFRRTGKAKYIPLVPEAMAVLLERWPGGQLKPRRAGEGWEVVDERDGATWPMLPTSAWATRLPEASGPVFPGATPSRPLTDIYHPWRDNIAVSATRQRVREADVHGLRHAGASLLKAAGVPTELIQQVLHHASPSTTEIYTHTTADALLRLASILAGGERVGRCED